MKFASVIILILLFSCSATKIASHARQKLSVSFFSRGAGIDYKKKQEFDTYLKDFEKTENVRLVLNQVKWGREGEVDYCIQVKSLPKSKQKNFLGGVQLILSSSSLVRISEVDTCKH